MSPRQCAQMGVSWGGGFRADLGRLLFLLSAVLRVVELLAAVSTLACGPFRCFCSSLQAYQTVPAAPSFAVKSNYSSWPDK